MRAWIWLVAMTLLAAGGDLGAQRRGAAKGNVSFAVAVTDPAGQPIPNVVVTVEGAAQRTARTEGGRIALEGLPPGNYLLRFEHEGFVTVERELSARGARPVDVKVTLKPLPAPPPPPAPPAPAISAKPMAADIPALVASERVGKAPSRVSSLACGAGGTATLIQLNQPLAQQVHADADAFLYVVAGEGHALVGTGKQKLEAGFFLFVPRGMTYSLTPSGRNPLVVMSTRAGEPCRQAG